MMKRLLTILALVLLTSPAFAQQRTFYDSSGNVVGRAATDSQGTTTVYDAGGKLTGREVRTGKYTTFYDANGRNVGKATQGVR